MPHEAASLSVICRSRFKELDSLQQSLGDRLDVLVGRDCDVLAPEEFLCSQSVTRELRQNRRCSTSASIERLPFNCFRSQRRDNRSTDDAPQIDGLALAVWKNP